MFQFITYIIIKIIIDTDDYNPPKTELQPQIVLDHQLFSFNATHKIIGWNFKNNQSCAPPVTFTVDLLTCDSDDPVQTWTTQDSELTIKSEQKKESLYFRISASDKDHAKCPATTTDFQVPSDPYGMLFREHASRCTVQSHYLQFLPSVLK